MDSGNRYAYCMVVKNIPFQRNGARPISLTEEESDDCWQTRAEYTLADFLEMESGTALEEEFERWLSRGNDVSRTAKCVSHLKGILNVAGIENPMGYRFAHHKDKSLIGCELIELWQWEGHYLPGSLEYMACRDSGIPACHQIEQNIAGVYRFYRRIMFPAEAGIYIFSRQLIESEAV